MLARLALIFIYPIGIFSGPTAAQVLSAEAGPRGIPTIAPPAWPDRRIGAC
ncbi:hypothetical protein [Salipiger sp. PrR003]|uniref:hypothetical protein n=1 Tax=Salipiger sp. PrR003 TaxID=2706776 RepID=UPI0013DB8DE1|nr:hypothetical protein [Salipiger sp. PrR003]NDV50347.1 hypothetical protein [Salipiger sp. PrR003]